MRQRAKLFEAVLVCVCIGRRRTTHRTYRRHVGRLGRVPCAQRSRSIRNPASARNWHVNVGPTWRTLADRLQIPASTVAVVWGMDGVLVDTLLVDFQVVARLLQRYGPQHPGVDHGFIRSVFPYDPKQFWQRILANASYQLHEETFDQLLADYETLRRTTIAS